MKDDGQPFCVILVKSVSHALIAEKLVKAAELPCKLIPVPRHIGSDCGVCLRIPQEKIDEAARCLAGKVEVELIRPLKD